MDVWLEMWVDFVYWQWGGRAGVGGVRLVFVSDTHALSDVWSSDEGAGGGGCVFAWHGMALGFVRLYHCNRYVLNRMDIVLGSNFGPIPFRLDSAKSATLQWYGPPLRGLPQQKAKPNPKLQSHPKPPLTVPV